MAPEAAGGARDGAGDGRGDGAGGRAGDGAADAFARRGRFVEHPLLQGGRVPWDDAVLSAARRALRHGTLLVAPPGGAVGEHLPLLVAAERHRSAGGLVVHLTPSRGGVRRLAARYADGLGPTATPHVEAVLASLPAAKRRDAWSSAWVVCASVEQALADSHGGVADFGRCSLLVLDSAERAVGSPGVADLLRALRAARPGALVLAVARGGAKHRRRLAAIMEAVGVRQLEVIGAAGGEGGASGDRSSGGPPGPEVVEVDLPADLAAAREALESELAARVGRLVNGGWMPPSDARWVTADALVEAAGRARRARADARSTEALRAQAQALLLLEAIGRLEEGGPQAAARFIDRLGAGPEPVHAERSLARSSGMAQAARALARLGANANPKGARLCELVRNALLERPGARVVVVARHVETAADLARALAEPPPVGTGRPVTQGPSPAGALRVLTSARAGPRSLASADVVVFHDVSAFADVRPPAPTARGARTVVLVARGGREEQAMGRPSRVEGGGSGQAPAATRPERSGAAQVLIDEFAGARPPRRGGRRP